MPKYWGKQIFTYGSFSEAGQKQKTERERERGRIRDRNGQIRIASPPQVAHAKPPGPTTFECHPFRYRPQYATS